MKRIGVLGGISPQATMDFEARVHRISQQLIPQDFNRGYPAMVVWDHRRPPVRLDADGRAIMPMEVDPELVEAAARLGKMADFLVIPCNAAHVGLDAIQKAADRPVLSMIEITADEVARRGCAVPACWASPALPGRTSRRSAAAASGARAWSGRADPARCRHPCRRRGPRRRGGRPRGADRRGPAAGATRGGVVLGCTEIPLLLGEDADTKDLVSPAALLAEAAVRMAIGDGPRHRTVNAP